MNLKEELERLFLSDDASLGTHSAAKPLLNAKGVPIEELIDIVTMGGEVQTGIDIFNKNGVLLLEKSARIKDPKPLLIIRQNGIFEVPISRKNRGGLWDAKGKPIEIAHKPDTVEAPPEAAPEDLTPITLPSLETRLREIDETKDEIAERQQRAKESMRGTVLELKKSGGRFDVNRVRKSVTELTDFLEEDEKAVSFLAREIFLADEFLFNHSVNVCAIGTVILKHFNTQFSHSISSHLQKLIPGTQGHPESFLYYSPEDIRNMAIGYFLHDIGKTAIPERILNKPSRLTEAELEISKSHSYRKGMALLEKNNITNSFIQNIVRDHHAPLYPEETGGYPRGKATNEIPPYVKICKIADIYDAMTSKRFHSDALNPIRVVTSIIRTYANKDPMLQFILHAFVGTVGIHPPGSIVYLTNRQMAYIIDSRGPIVLPFTDTRGLSLATKSDYIDLGSDARLAVDSRDPVITPREAYKLLPSFLKSSLFGKGR